MLTLFPEAITQYATTSVLGRAHERGVWELHVHDFREATDDVHRTVDDTPFGGGAGMVLRAEPILRTIEETPDLARPVIALTPSGRTFDHAVAKELSALARLHSAVRSLRGFRPAGPGPRGRRRGLARRFRPRRRGTRGPVRDRGGRATSTRGSGQRRVERGRVIQPTDSSSTPSTPNRRACADATCPRSCVRATTPASRAGAGPRRSRRTLARRPDLIERRGGLSAGTSSCWPNSPWWMSIARNG